MRKWHRWIGFPASIFLLFAAVTGILLAVTEFFGEEEALRERTRELVSPVTVQTPDADLAAMLARYCARRRMWTNRFWCVCTAALYSNALDRNKSQ